MGERPVSSDVMAVAASLPWLRHPRACGCYAIAGLREQLAACTCGMYHALASLAPPPEPRLSEEERKNFDHLTRTVEGCADHGLVTTSFGTLRQARDTIARLSASDHRVKEGEVEIEKLETVVLEGERWCVRFWDAEGDDGCVEVTLRLYPPAAPAHPETPAPPGEKR